MASDKERDDPEDGGWRQLIAGGGLLAAVCAILVVGAVLETPEAPARGAASDPPSRSEAIEETPAARPPASDPSGTWQPAQLPETLVREEEPPAAAATSDEPVLDAISRRCLEDPMRLRKSEGRFTAQLAFVCRRESAERLLDRSGGSAELFVLPEAREGQDCFRVCYGAYATREAAVAAGIPATLRDGLGKPEAKRIAEILP